VTLRRKFTLYLVTVHLVFATVIAVLLWDDRIWIVGVEALLVVSFLVAQKLFRGVFRPLELISTSAEFLKDRDFSTRLRETGPPEMDRLIGVFNQMIGTLRTERLSLQEQHFFLNQVLTVSPSAILILDHDGLISQANPAALSLFRTTAEDLTGKPVSAAGEPFGPLMGKMRNGESTVLTVGGARKVLCRKSGFMDRGHPRSFFLFEELTEELRRLEKGAYEKVIRTLSHEVHNSLGASNSLLHSCMTYASQLDPADRADFENALTVAISRTEHLNSFMKSFADIMRLPPPRPVPTDLRKLLEGIASLMHAELAKRRIALKWEGDDWPGPTAVDAHQMEQVFLNVLKNAMEAIGTDGTITLRAGRVNGRASVTIEDTGSGITEEARQQLFTPFFSTKENGQGIGLTLVREVLAHHNFEFALESTPGGPTRFTVYPA